MVLEGYASDAARLISQAQGVVSDLGDQLESVEEGFDVPSINQLQLSASELDRQLEVARTAAQKLASAITDAIINDNPAPN